MTEVAARQLVALDGWRDGDAKRAIVDFVESVVSLDMPVEERVAVFDNDGTLWCEKPMPIQADFIIRRLSQMAEDDPSLRERQPWKAAHERDYAWFGKVLADHYAGDDREIPTLLGGVLAAHAGIGVDEFESLAESFLRSTSHPTLGRGYLETAYRPMIDLLRYLEANGFTNYIASGGGRDFMRPISQEIYGIDRERVIGSTTSLEYVGDDNGGTVVRKPAADYLDDGPEKPIRIWSRIGRRPLLAGGNSNGDIEMLDYAQHPDRPSLRLLILHDDGAREFAYTSGAERALERAERFGWTVASIRDDWLTVF
jgi:phosphoserine phosphatase